MSTPRSVATAIGSLTQHSPLVYQQIDSARVAVPGRFVPDGDNVRFAIGGYVRTHSLVIDPVPMWSDFRARFRTQRSR